MKALNALTGKSDEIPQALVDRVLETVKAEGVEGSDQANEENVRLALEQMKIMDVVKGKAGIGGINKKDMGEHKFWRTQPVPQMGEGPPIDDGYIEPSKPREEVRQEPYPLPKDFEWTTMDVNDPAQSKEVYDLLSLNYVEDDDATFRFRYSAQFLEWALKPPGYFKEWHVGVRVKSNKKLVGFIAGVPILLRVRKNKVTACEINYLCVHKKLRSKRLAPVLIKEVTRQVHLKGIFQAIYTVGLVLPTPVSNTRYYHRALNVSKLVDVKFSYVPRNMTLARMIRLNKLSDKTSLPGLREMEEKDVQEVAALYSKFMERYDMIPLMTVDEVRHQFLSGNGTGKIGDGGPGRREGQVTWAYVVEDPETHKITDFFSIYSLPSTIINNPTHSTLEAAYLYYYASDIAFESDADEDGKLKKRLQALIGDALIVANQAQFDVFNALTLMDNVSFLQELRFGQGDGILNFYLYNWRTARLAGMNSEGGVPAGRGVGVVMV
ncbi:N-myristoyl transferase [Dendrothele bispora CBS 962.96]|uniref:Glycylpeptide N-tetradecanoyltransferase n=1 Tax=Dendrothele bispora (strain CBS 962.96) TaxID=1314807 RepID=A0A4S8LEY5_DENBC|nr:N-myristoyl transferase [Dendrothele bispora CBS 962.96]THU88437.1 N-myristoyl transferase [Dendrothele bispora CBS 962.96]